MKLTKLLPYLMMGVAFSSAYDTSFECCPQDTGVCSTGAHTYGIPLLDLSVRGNDRPTIDGLIDSQYSRFLELPMYNGGKNGGDDRIATAYLAYDCTNNVVCVAAQLDASFMEANPSVEVEEDDGESWIRFGEKNGAGKLKASNADEFRYIGKPNDPYSMIGYEGCWSVDSIRKMESVVNNYVEVHFSNDGDTTSTGKPASNGEFVCLTPMCMPITSTPTPRPSEVSE